MDRAVLRSIAMALCVCLPVLGVSAQSADSTTTVRATDALARVRRYTTSDVGAARALADSLVTTMPAGATAMPDALFARASIAPSAAEAERDYARIVTDYRFAARVPDALMRLALLESARNNGVMALRHLERLLRDHNDAPVRSRASLLAGRLRLDANDPARACDLLAAAYASAGINERDVKDQAESLGAKCPTPIVTMAQREPPPMGVVRAARETPAPSVAVTPTPAPRRSRRDSAAVTRPSAPVVRRDTVSTPTAAPPVVRRETAPTPKPAPALVRRDTAPTPKPAPAVVRRDTAPTPKPAPAVVRRDTAATPKPAPAVARRDTAPTQKPTPAVVRRDTAPTPKPAPAVVRRDTAPAPAAATGAGRFGVQFAAYNDRPGAEQFAAVLRGRGITARVEGTAAPFRVRAGRFTTRAEAEASAALWRRPGQPAIVVVLGPTP